LRVVLRIVLRRDKFFSFYIAEWKMNLERWREEHDNESDRRLFDKKNEISSIFVDLVFFIFCWRMRQFLFRTSWDSSHIAHFALMMNIWQTLFWWFDFSHQSHFKIERHWFSM
jgi:hypothetical protein